MEDTRTVDQITDPDDMNVGQDTQDAQDGADAVDRQAADPRAADKNARKAAYMAAKRRAAAIRNQRGRNPIGVRSKLEFPGRPGFVRRVFNDDEGRIRDAETRGWTPVKEADLIGGDVDGAAAKQIGATVRRPVGGGTHGVLMEIPEEIYNEDQTAKQQKVADVEKVQLNQGNKPGFYGDIVVERSQ